MTELEREFIGLFWGEGSIVFMGRQSSKQAPVRGYRLTFQIHMRADDLSMLEYLQKEFGGKIYHKKGRLRYFSKGTAIVNPLIENPSCYWMIFRREECERILSLLEKSLLPSSKRKQLVVARKLFSILPNRPGKGRTGHRYSDNQLIEQVNLRKEIISLRVFNGS